MDRDRDLVRRQDDERFTRELSETPSEHVDVLRSRQMEQNDSRLGSAISSVSK